MTWAFADTLWHNSCAFREFGTSVLLHCSRSIPLCATNHGGVHPMLRHLVDAALQRSEQAFPLQAACNARSMFAGLQVSQCLCTSWECLHSLVAGMGTSRAPCHFMHAVHRHRKLLTLTGSVRWRQIRAASHTARTQLHVKIYTLCCSRRSDRGSMQGRQHMTDSCNPSAKLWAPPLHTPAHETRRLSESLDGTSPEMCYAPPSAGPGMWPA